MDDRRVAAEVRNWFVSNALGNLLKRLKCDEEFACRPVENRVQQQLQARIRKIPGELENGAMAAGAQGQVAVREVMDIRQAADYLGISGDTLYRYASEGFVPAFKLGNRWRFRKSLLDSWMDEKSGVAPQAAVDPAAKKPVARAR